MKKSLTQICSILLFAFVNSIMFVNLALADADTSQYRVVLKNYKAWLAIANNDFYELVDKVKAGSRLTKADIHSIFHDSFDKKSTPLSMFADLCIKEKHAPCSNRKNRLYMKSFFMVLEHSIPTVEILNQEKFKGLVVVYLEPSRKLASANPYRNNRVPKNGSLKRDVMPFVGFRVSGEKMYLVNVSREFMVVVDNVHYQLWQ